MRVPIIFAIVAALFTQPITAGPTTQRLTQEQALAALRQRRNQADVDRSLDELRLAAGGDINMMPALLEAVKSYATLGEMIGALKDVFGVYTEAARW